MLYELRKMWLDTTTFEGRYVAKDVRNAVAFLGGLVLVAAYAVVGIINKTLSMEPGTTLLIFSLGGGALKSYYQYKNNAVASDCPNAGPPGGDSEIPSSTKAQEAG